MKNEENLMKKTFKAHEDRENRDFLQIKGKTLPVISRDVDLKEFEIYDDNS